MDRKDVEKLKALLRHYKNLLDAAWVDSVDKDYKFREVDGMMVKLSKSDGRGL